MDRGFAHCQGPLQEYVIEMARRDIHWRDKLITEHRGAKIVKHINISKIINDVDYYTLFDERGDSIARGIDCNELRRQLFSEKKEIRNGL